MLSGTRTQRSAYSRQKESSALAGAGRSCRLIAYVSTNGTPPAPKPVSPPNSSELSMLMEELHSLRRQVSELKSAQSEHLVSGETSSRRSWYALIVLNSCIKANSVNSYVCNWDVYVDMLSGS